MKANINKLFLSAVVEACCFVLAGGTNLDETLYDTISTEKHEFSKTELEHTIAPVYSSLRTVYWGWFGLSDIMDMSSDVWVYRLVSVSAGETYMFPCISMSSTLRWASFR